VCASLKIHEATSGYPRHPARAGGFRCTWRRRHRGACRLRLGLLLCCERFHERMPASLPVLGG
jgi:hypothetical protein